MIIKLGKHNKAKELLLEKVNTGHSDTHTIGTEVGRYRGLLWLSAWRGMGCQEWESREGGVHQGESQITLGAWENTQRDQGGSNTRSSELWSAQAAILHKDVYN